MELPRSVLTKNHCGVVYNRLVTTSALCACKRSTVLKAEIQYFVLRQSARALAVLVLLYFLSAFIQTGYITLQETVVGILWVLLCYVLSRTVGPMTLLASSFAASILWANLLRAFRRLTFTPSTDMQLGSVQVSLLNCSKRSLRLPWDTTPSFIGCWDRAMPPII